MSRPGKRLRSAAAPPDSERHVIVFDVGARAPALHADASLLRDFVHPLSPAAFKSEFLHGRAAVAFLGGGERRVRRILDELLLGGDVAALADATASERIHCWLRPLGGSAPLETVKVDDAASAVTLHAAGASLYHRAPPDAEAALVPALSEGIDGAFAAYFDAGAQAEPRGEVEVFASRKGHATRWHFDWQTNFTFQLRGSKTWRVRRGVAAPVRGATPHFTVAPDVLEQQVRLHRLADARFDFAPPGHDAAAAAAPRGADFFGDCDTVTLHAGDLLFFPAGAWHDVVADEDSLSINVSLVQQTWRELGAAAVSHLLLRDEGARRGVAVPWAGVVAAGARSSSGGALEVHQIGSRGGAGSDEIAAGADDGRATRTSVAPLRRDGTVGAAEADGGAPSLVLPPALDAQLRGMLQRLVAAVSRLTPSDLLPPAALLSFRYDDAVAEAAGATRSGRGGSSGADGGDDDDEAVDEDEEEAGADTSSGSEGGSSGRHSSGSSSSGDAAANPAARSDPSTPIDAPPSAASVAVSRFCAAHGVAIELRDGVLHLSRRARDEALSAATVPRFLRINPLALVIPCKDLLPPSASTASASTASASTAGPPRERDADDAAASVAFAALVNFGGGDDFAPQSRVVIHVPADVSRGFRVDPSSQSTRRGRRAAQRGPAYLGFPPSVMARVVALTAAGSEDAAAAGDVQLDVAWVAAQVSGPPGGAAACTAADAADAAQWLAAALCVAGVAAVASPTTTTAVAYGRAPAPAVTTTLYCPK